MLHCHLNRQPFARFAVIDRQRHKADTLSWEKHAHPDSPSTFLWHTAEDDAVPVENSYQMAMALQHNKTPHELHVFPTGEHGLGLCSIDFHRQASAAQWRPLAERWFLELGF